jgi:hypothetical protein
MKIGQLIIKLSHFADKHLILLERLTLELVFEIAISRYLTVLSDIITTHGMITSIL